ncbi:hypothetical protein AQUCO_08600027v1 [Aquilegia coerulea]|uniref:MULE transposase domain-containing protein n=1 Tax=Aquilegia coerulea TaxID=218851 RepID=A0A2G5C6I3_AQUCA|nr:hypothetical protein AQUCO_08600027v1 [Aquilegia coerulea]
MAVTRHFEYKQKSNDPSRFRLKCKDSTCKWYISCYRAGKNDCTMVLYKFYDVHTCASLGKNTHTHAKAPWVAEEVYDYMVTHPESQPKDIKREIYKMYGEKISYWTAWSARKIVMERMNGSFEESFAQTPELVKQILKGNPGSIVRCYVDGNKQFEGFFVAYKSCLDGWSKGCRPVVGLDGCHLKGKYEGVCLSVIGLDGNNGLYPLAIYITRSETLDSWMHFLTLIEPNLKKRTKGSGRDILTFFSDRQTGLVKAVSTVFSGAYHRFCYRHMIANYKNNGFKGEHLVNLAWAGAKAFKVSEHEKMMEILKNENVKAKEYLEREPVQSWARCHFDKTSKCEYNNNNFSESFNKWILEVRHIPICRLVDRYSEMLSKQIYDRKVAGLELEEDDLVPRVKHIIQKLDKKYFKYDVQGVSLDILQVKHKKSNKKWTVEIKKHRCNCIEWQMSGGAWNTGGSCTGKSSPALEGHLVENGFTNIMHEKQVMGFKKAIKKVTNRSKLRLMDITEAFSYRHDGHPGPYRNPDPNKITKRGPHGEPPPQDCLHWCMPGPVDTWNEIVLEIIRREFEGTATFPI